MSTFIIAEAGSNHDGNYEQAIDLINIAKESGADAVKFQTAKSENLYAIDTPSIAGYDDVRKLIKNIELPREWQYDLKKYCDEIGIGFMSSVFSIGDADLLKQVVTDYVKIPSMESRNTKLINYCLKHFNHLLISTGTSTCSGSS